MDNFTSKSKISVHVPNLASQIHGNDMNEKINNALLNQEVHLDSSSTLSHELLTLPIHYEMRIKLHDLQCIESLETAVNDKQMDPVYRKLALVSVQRWISILLGRPLLERY